MARTYTAQSVTSVNPLRFETKGDVVTGVIVSFDVNYGELGMTHQLDIWGYLTPAQRNKAEEVYNFIQHLVEGIILE